MIVVAPYSIWGGVIVGILGFASSKKDPLESTLRTSASFNEIESSSQAKSKVTFAKNGN